MESFAKDILECQLKIDALSIKLDTFEGQSNINNLTPEQGAIIAEVSISLYTMMDKFPIIILEELGSEELKRLNELQIIINIMQARIQEIVGIKNKG